MLFGAPKIGVLAILNADTLSWKRCRSEIENVRINSLLNWGAVFRRRLGLRSLAVRSVSGGRCTRSDMLVDPILPGFELPLRDVFS